MVRGKVLQLPTENGSQEGYLKRTSKVTYLIKEGEVVTYKNLSESFREQSNVADSWAYSLFHEKLYKE